MWISSSSNTRASLSFFHILFIYLFWSLFSKDTEGITEKDTGYLRKNTSEISTCRSMRQWRRCRVSISSWEENKDLRIEERHWSCCYEQWIHNIKSSQPISIMSASDFIYRSTWLLSSTILYHALQYRNITLFRIFWDATMHCCAHFQAQMHISCQQKEQHMFLYLIFNLPVLC